MQSASFFIAALVAASAFAAAGPPLASSWNIATTGKATSSGDLEFRITRGDGSNPVDISVPVISGATQDSVARSIGRSLSSQLPRERYSVQLGENGNVMVSDPRGQPNFSLELVDATIESVRVAVQSVTPAAPPTVPPQAAPAEPPPASPTTTPPREAPPVTAPTSPAPANTPPATPPPANSPPPSNSDSAGAPASAPPPR